MVAKTTLHVKDSHKNYGIILQDMEGIEEKYEKYSKTHRAVVAVIFAAILALMSAFFWRTFSFYQKIQRREINPALGYTTTDFTRAVQAFAQSAVGAERGAVATIDDPFFGATAPSITIVEFSDFGCPFSREVAPIIRAIAQQYSTDVQWIFRDFPMEELHPGATFAAQAGGCAAEQGKFWEYHDAVFELQGDLTSENIFTISDDIDLDGEEFARCVKSNFYRKDVAGDIADGMAAGVTGTPTFFFNGQKVEGSIPFTIFNQIINAMHES